MPTNTLWLLSRVNDRVNLRVFDAIAGAHALQREVPSADDAYLEFHDLERSHQGYRLKGRTPAHPLREALGIEGLPAFVPAEEEPTTPAA
jgi:hypothetical protein